MPSVLNQVLLCLLQILTNMAYSLNTAQKKIHGTYMWFQISKRQNILNF